MVILEENFKWHLEAFASELFIYIYLDVLWLRDLDGNADYTNKSITINNYSTIKLF